MRQPLLNAIIRFAETRDAVSALVLVGSQARAERKADAYSDIDLLMVVEDTEPFLRSDAWLSDIGEYHISFAEKTIDGQPERRVLFDDAQDVDFVILRRDAALRALRRGDTAAILSRGYRVLVDKLHLELPPPVPQAEFAPATEAEFDNIVQDFWFHTVWTAKKLMRGELWTAKFCADGYMKWKLMWMIEQHEHAVRRSGLDTWYRGRFVEHWAREDILAGLQNAFAHYDRADIASALLETMKLFRLLAREVSAACGFAYPAHADAYAAQWVLPQLDLLLQARRKGEEE